MTCRARWFPLLMLAVLTGCAAVPSVSPPRLIASQAMLDFHGLSAVTLYPSLKLDAAVPLSWQQLKPEQMGPLAHRQWRSPTRSTGLGLAYIKLPWPVSPRFLIWVAKMQYAKRTTRDGKPAGQLLAEWTDPQGREWFDAEDEKFHVQGYAVTDGFDAWVVYAAYRRSALNWPELALANRAVRSALPAPLVHP